MSDNVICPSKIPPIDQGLREFQDYIDENYGSYDQFKNTLLAQLSSGNLSPQIESLIRDRLNNADNPFNPGKYIHGVNEYLSSTGLAGVGEQIKYIADRINPKDLFEYGTLQSVKQYAKGYVTLGAYLGILQAGTEIYKSDHKLSETGKQFIIAGSGILIGAAVTAGVAAAAPLLGLGAGVVTVGSAVAGTMAATAGGNILGSLWDKVFDHVQASKLAGLGEADAIELAALDLLKDVEDLFDNGAFGKSPIDNPNNPFCLPPNQPNTPGPWLPPNIIDPWDGTKRVGPPQDGSPLVLDLGAKGIHLLDRAEGEGVYWDIDSDGFREMSGWVGPEDGLLVIDRNGNGTIDNNKELFGNQPADGVANGFAALSAFDSNKDGKITSADKNFSKLKVWVDANSDGISQASELKTLAQLKITSINLNYTDTWRELDGNTIMQESTFVMNGETRKIVDAWFSYDDVNTQYNGNYTLDPRVLFMPTTRGYGRLPDLHIAMSKDPTLLSLVQTLATKDMSQLLDPAFNLEAKLKNILYRWAGIQNVDPDKYGMGVDQVKFDAREFDFIKKFLGDDQATFNIWAGGAQYHSIFQKLLGVIGANILLQSGFSELYGNPVYDPISDTFQGGNAIAENSCLVFGSPKQDYFSPTDMNDIYVFRPGDGVLTDGYQDMIIFSEPNKGTDMILFSGIDPSTVRMWTDGTDKLIINYGTNNSLVVMTSGLYNESHIGDFLKKIVFDNGTTWDLTKGLNMVDTDESHYSIYGSCLADRIDGRGGNDQIYGYGGNDTIIGGKGGDYLVGGAGNDTYVFSKGDGIPGSNSQQDYIYEARNEGTADTIRLKGVLPTDVKVWTDSYTLNIQYGAGDIIHVSIFRQADGSIRMPIERVVFDNGTVWDWSKGLNMVDTDESHYSIYGSSLADTIDGRGGNDTIYGYGGNDTIIGGKGADYLTGGAGNDTYVFSKGDGIPGSNSQQDYIYEARNEGTADTIRLKGVLPTDVKVWTDSYTLNIQYGAGDIIHVSIFRQADGSIRMPIERVVFDNGTVWDWSKGLNMVDTDESHYSIYGSSLADTIDGRGGNDTIYGYDGNDTIIGGKGGDYLVGGAGNDTYVFSKGDGIPGSNSQQDYVYEAKNEGTGDTIRLKGILPSEVRIWSDNSYLNIQYSPTDIVRVSIIGYSDGSVTSPIEKITFDDGTIWDLSTGLKMTDTDEDHQIYGSQYNDTIDGRGGNDYIYSYGGNDTLLGRTGNDQLYGGNGNDALYGQTGNDYLSGDTGNDLLVGGLGGDSLNGGGGIDTASYRDAAASVTADLVNYSINTGEASGDTYNSIENILGSNYNDILSGNSASNTLRGGGGNDVISGRVGSDMLYGENGSDVFVFVKGDTAGAAIDKIMDFKLSENDKIDIKNLLQGYDPLTKAITDFVQITNNGADSILKIDANGGGDNFVQIASIMGVTGLTNEQALINSGHLIVA